MSNGEGQTQPAATDPAPADLAQTDPAPADPAQADPAQTDPAQEGLIVVGVSAATGSTAAIRWAAQEGKKRGARVRAVMAWRPTPLPGTAPGRPPAQHVAEYDLGDLAEDALAELVATALGPDHDVECRAVEGKAGSVLLEEAREAVLLVLDSPRMAKLTSPNARRLASKLIFRSPVPVVVMPAPAHAVASGIQDAADVEAPDDGKVAEAVGASGPLSRGPIST